MRLAIVSLAVTLATTGCGGDGSNLDTGPGPGPEVTQLSFTVQPSPVTAGQAITPPVQVSLQDASGTLLRTGDNPVTLALESNPSGATLRGTRTVNAQGGVASFSDLQISQPGAGFTLSASAPGLTSARSSAFDVSPILGLAVAIAPAAGDGQTAMVNQPVPINPSVRITDGLGNPVANVAVTFSVHSGDGTVIGPNQITDAAGVATVGQWTLGVFAQGNSLVANSPGLAGSPVAFQATATAGPATGITKSAGDAQLATMGTAVLQPPSVYVADRFGNAVGGVAVTFKVTSGGGRITGAQQTTGTDGLATVGGWTLGNSPGVNTLRATSSGLDGSPATFHASATRTSPNATVEVRNYYFRSMQNGSGSDFNLFGQAAVDTIPVGGTVTWLWVGANHNVTPFENSASSPLSGSGNHNATYTYGPVTFNTPGLYRYRCTNHSSIVQYLGLVGMRGEIVVQ